MPVYRMKKSSAIIATSMILVTGGTGFIGKALIRQLVATGNQVRTLLRPSPQSPNLPRGVPVEVAVSSLLDERGLRAAMKDVDVIFHLAGAERLSSRADLQGVDVEGTRILTDVAARAGVERVFMLSHLGADKESAYKVLRAKAIAETLIIKSGVGYTILRTGPVFGPGDQFTTSLAKVLRMTPFIFLQPGDGSSVIQPVWIEDLVACLVWALQEPSTMNQVYSIGGMETLSFHSIIQSIMAASGAQRWIVPLQPAYLRSLAVWLEHSRPNFPISLYWLDYLAADRTCSTDSMTRLFGLMPARFHQHLDYLKPGKRS